MQGGTTYNNCLRGASHSHTKIISFGQQNILRNYGLVNRDGGNSQVLVQLLLWEALFQAAQHACCLMGEGFPTYALQLNRSSVKGDHLSMGGSLTPGTFSVS